MHRRPRCAIALLALAILSGACAKSPVGPLDSPWRVMPGHVETLNIPAFRGGRACWIYLPPGYAETDARYPVLYINDGGFVFDQQGGLHFNRIAEDLIRRGEMEPLIMVAIAAGYGPVRTWEYTPWAGNFNGYPTGGGDAYLRAVRDTLKPEVDRRFRTLPDRWHTAMAGYSLGGLISAYAFFAFDTTFGRAGAFSPTYGLGMYSWIYGERHPPWRVLFYQDTGTVADNDIQFMESALTSMGFELGQDLMSLTETGATHTGAAWEHRMPGMLQFVFPRDDGGH